MEVITIKQGDSALNRTESISRKIKKDQRVQLNAAGSACQKLLAIVEKIKHTLKEPSTTVHQYNKLESIVIGEEEKKKKKKMQVPQLQVVLSLTKLGEEYNDWSYQSS